MDISHLSVTLDFNLSLPVWFSLPAGEESNLPFPMPPRLHPRRPDRPWNRIRGWKRLSSNSGRRPMTSRLAGKVAYGEDRYSRISSPLQGRVLEVRAHLGERVQAGSVLLVLDSQEIAQAYSEYVKEDSDLQYATRAHDLAKDLYENKALPLKDLKQAENELIKARAEFRRAKERLLSLRVPAQELEKPLERQKITSRFEMKSPLTGIVVERNVTPGQSIGGESGQVLFTVADLDMLQVVADVYERDLAISPW